MPSRDAREIALLVVANAFVGGLVGLERTVLPLLAEAEFGLASAAAASSFVVAFGASKAVVNLLAGRLADRFGRKRVLLAGWLFGLPVPLLVIAAPEWSWIVAANVLLGVNQGLAWSMTVNMKLDRVGPGRRGLVVGLNETAGYVGVAIAAYASGVLAASFGLRPVPFLLGVGLAFVGLALSLAVRDTRAPRAARAPAAPGLAGASVAGLATNLKDGALWALLPVALAARGVDLAAIAVVVAAYPLAWGLAQAGFGPLSDRIGRRGLAAGGLLVQALGVAALVVATGLTSLVAAAVVLGLGTAMTYPTLLALVADLAPPAQRATSLGVYRFWRDAGYAVGALGAGLLADRLGFDAALLGVAAVVGAASAGIVRRPGRRPVPEPT